MEKNANIEHTLQSDPFCSCLPLSLEWKRQVFGTAQEGDPIFAFNLNTEKNLSKTKEILFQKMINLIEQEGDIIFVF